MKEIGKKARTFVSFRAETATSISTAGQLIIKKRVEGIEVGDEEEEKTTCTEYHYIGQLWKKAKGKEEKAESLLLVCTTSRKVFALPMSAGSHFNCTIYVFGFLLQYHHSRE